ncbi:MAG: hypothetical protein AAGI66_01565 [Cyanobacteria bacterium P01_H01_bin.74]
MNVSFGSQAKSNTMPHGLLTPFPWAQASNAAGSKKATGLPFSGNAKLYANTPQNGLKLNVLA